MPKNYTQEEAQRILKELSVWGGIVPTWHAAEKSGPDRNFDMQDALEVIRNGHIAEGPEYDQAYKNWKCVMEGQDKDGDTLTVVVAFDPDEKEVIIITGY